MVIDSDDSSGAVVIMAMTKLVMVLMDDGDGR